MSEILLEALASLLLHQRGFCYGLAAALPVAAFAHVIGGSPWVYAGAVLFAMLAGMIEFVWMLVNPSDAVRLQRYSRRNQRVTARPSAES